MVKDRHTLFKVLRFIRNVIEEYVPVVCFAVLFISFIAQVFWRYVLRNPIGWTSELIVVMFVWMVLFGSLYSSRTNSHIRFTMITDALPPKVALCFELAGNLLVALMFVLSFIPSWKYINFMAIQKTSVLHIPMPIVFAPYVIMLAGVILYTVAEVIDNIRALMGKPPLKGEEAKEA